RPGLVHNRAKIRSHRDNAQAFLVVEEEFGGFETYLRQMMGGRPRRNLFVKADEVPTQTSESILLSQDLVRRGFRFVGPTICYSFMQSVGLVQDHLLGCFRDEELAITAPG
ncbi:MAG: DNA-3-methyladenine glycosylase I, partial [Firmicutes bacterium]|nr:DNA-3-methyladenine glycosylase I [Bacillota bacterium]